jgi:EAL domain-containing protein (putative c-di-GMP-specific phosphodiesterase class I)/ABC-type amino acid transport substrate-binding protein
MKINLKVFFFILIFTYTLLIGKNVKAETNNYNDKVYKIGVIKLESYVDINEKGEFQGYYIDLFDLIGKELNLKYEYVLVSVVEAINKLENGELDFALGITLTESRAEKLLFNIYPMAFEKFALYTNKDINSYNLNELNGLRFGVIKAEATNWILDFFKAANINVDVIYGDNYDEINEWIDNGSLDLILDSAYKETKYKKIYEFVESQVYIAANKNNKELLNSIDNTIVKINEVEENKIDNLYNSYFHKDKVIKEKIENILIILLEIIFLSSVIRILFPKLKKELYKIKIRKLIKGESYSIYYQPIYKAKSKEIVGVEARLKDKINNEYLSYSKDLLSRFKESSIISYVCLWKLEKIISDYEEIKNYNSLSKDDFYISLNIPINQFKNNRFVKKLIKILNKSELHKNSICIEVMGNINTKNIDTITKNIKRLKEAGFIIAIDDFGIEYSNLNMIQELDIDIIKIDKTFTYNMDKSLLKNEIIKFISRIGKAQNKFIVLEGIYELGQHKKVKEIDNDKLCVQGSFYSKPISIEEIKASISSSC